MEETNTQQMLTKASFLLGIAWSAITALKSTLDINGLPVAIHEENAYNTLTDGIQELYYPKTKEQA